MVGSKTTELFVAHKDVVAREATVAAQAINNQLPLPPLQDITNSGAMIPLHPYLLQD